MNTNQEIENQKQYMEKVKNIIKELKKQNKYIDINIFTAFENVNLDKIVRYVKDGEEHTFLEEYDKDIHNIIWTRVDVGVAKPTLNNETGSILLIR